MAPLAEFISFFNPNQEYCVAETGYLEYFKSLYLSIYLMDEQCFQMTIGSLNWIFIALCSILITSALNWAFLLFTLITLITLHPSLIWYKSFRHLVLSNKQINLTKKCSQYAMTKENRSRRFEQLTANGLRAADYLQTDFMLRLVSWWRINRVRNGSIRFIPSVMETTDFGPFKIFLPIRNA